MKKEQEYTIFSMGDRIRERREELGMSREKMSALMRKIGSTVYFKTIEGWELGNHNCSITTIPYLCRVLDCDAEYLLGGSPTPHKETADASSVTGLSFKAIDNLKQIKKERVYLLPLISELIENEKGEARSKKRNGVDLIEKLLLYYMERKNEAYQVQFRAGIDTIGKTSIGKIIAEHFLNDIMRTIENYNPRCVIPDQRSVNLDVLPNDDDENRMSTPLEVNQFFGIGYGTRGKDGEDI